MRLRHPYTQALLRLLTLYTTPVVYLYVDRFRVWASALRTGHSADKIRARPAL